jgi:hypothetical protein
VKRATLFLTGLWLLGPREAKAASPEVTRCVDAYEQAQVLRDERKLSEARTELLTCARDLCPTVLRRDCTKWLEDVDRDMGSLVFRAVDARDRDIAISEIDIDGKPIASQGIGWAVTTDPGKHVVRVVVQGHPPSEQTVVVGQGEKNRVVVFRLAEETSAPQPKTEPKPPPPPAPHGAPVVAYVAGGVALLSLGTLAYAGLSGWTELSTLHDECGVTRSCTQADVDPVRTRLLVADIAAAVFVVAIGVSTYFFLRRGEPRAAIIHARQGVSF